MGFHTAHSTKRISQTANGILWLFFTTVIVAPRVIDLDVFYARDELTIWSWADQFTRAVWQGDAAGTLTNSDYPGIPVFWTQTALLTLKNIFPYLFPQTTASLDKESDDRSLSLLAERRLATALLVSLQLLALVWLTARFWGQHVAIISAILLGLDPFSLSESRVLRLEMVSAGFATLSLLAFLSYRHTRRLHWVLLSGVLAGLAVSSKTSAGLLVPCIWLLLLLDFVSVQGSRIRILRSIITAALLWALGSIFTFWIVWPAMWVQPLAALEHLWQTGFAQAANRSIWGDAVFFWGRVVEGGDPGPWFYPVALAFRSTPLVWLGVISAVVYLLRSALKTPSALLLSPIFALFLSIIILLSELTIIISKVDRFMLIFFPMLSILAAVGLGLLGKTLEQRIARHFGYRFISIGIWAFLILALQLTQTLPAHPYYFSYWNPVLGGGQAAMNILPMGAGEGVDQAMEYLNSQPDAAALTVVCGGSKPWCEHRFKGKTLRFATYASGEWFSADYATFYISHLQRGRYPRHIVDFFMKRKPVYQVDLSGATYMWVFKVPKVRHFAGAWNDLAGQARLLGFDLGEPHRRAGEAVEAEIWWENLGAGVDRLVLRLIDQAGYEWTRAYVSPLPEYANIPPEHLAVVAGRATVQLPLIMPPGQYFWRIGVVDIRRKHLIGEFSMPTGTSISISPALASIQIEPSQLQIAAPCSTQLAPEVMLLGYNMSSQIMNPESPVWLTLYWQAISTPPDYEVVLGLIDKTGVEVTRWQGRPAYGGYPMNLWSSGQIVQDVWPLRVDSRVPPGEYVMQISLDGVVKPNSSVPSVKRVCVIPSIRVWPHSVRFEVPDMGIQVYARFGDRLILLGYDLYFEVNGNHGALLPTFYWQSQASYEGAFDVHLTFYESSTGRELSKWSLPLGAGGYKTVWQEREVFATTYRLELGLLPGEQRYHLDLYLSPAGDGQPLTVYLNGQESKSLLLRDIQNKVIVLVR